MTEMARPYKREEDKVIIDNIDSIRDTRDTETLYRSRKVFRSTNGKS